VALVVVEKVMEIFFHLNKQICRKTRQRNALTIQQHALDLEFSSHGFTQTIVQ
jgi:hypothetical protein